MVVSSSASSSSFLRGVPCKQTHHFDSIQGGASFWAHGSRKHHPAHSEVKAHVPLAWGLALFSQA